MIRSIAFIATISLTLAGCGQKAERKEPVKPDPYKPLSMEEMILKTGREQGKAQWDIDCDLAFIGDLEAARRAKEVLSRLPYSQQSPRSQGCEGIVNTTIQKGGWKG